MPRLRAGQQVELGLDSDESVRGQSRKEPFTVVKIGRESGSENQIVQWGVPEVLPTPFI
jgi:hypothetical protein